MTSDPPFVYKVTGKIGAEHKVGLTIINTSLGHNIVVSAQIALEVLTKSNNKFATYWVAAPALCLGPVQIKNLREELRPISRGYTLPACHWSDATEEVDR